MHFAQPVPEEEMVAHFLRTEIHSARFGDEIRRLLARKRLDPSVVEAPDLSSLTENCQRADLLGDRRGYGRDGDVFKDMLENVSWWRAFLGTADLEQVKYINDDYWTEFSGGSRRVRDAARRIVSGAMPDVAAGYRSLADTLKKGTQFPELILLYKPPRR